MADLDRITCGECGFVFFVPRGEPDPLYCPRCRKLVTFLEG